MIGDGATDMEASPPAVSQRYQTVIVMRETSIRMMTLVQRTIFCLKVGLFSTFPF